VADSPQDIKARVIALAAALERNDHLDEAQWQMLDAIEAKDRAAPLPHTNAGELASMSIATHWKKLLAEVDGHPHKNDILGCVHVLNSAHHTRAVAAIQNGENFTGLQACLTKLPHEDATFERRVLDAVFAEGTSINSSVVNKGRFVVVNGLTGLDACERSVRECFKVLFEEEDGGDSPGRVGLVFVRKNADAGETT
jgi:hypothetical protein